MVVATPGYPSGVATVELSEALVDLKKALTGRWVLHHTRDEVVELAPARFAAWLGIQRSQLTWWRERYGKVNEHNGKIPRDHGILDWERQAILDFFDKNPLEGTAGWRT